MQPREEMANLAMQLALRVQDVTANITLQRQLLFEAIRWTEMSAGTFKSEVRKAQNCCSTKSSLYQEHISLLLGTL